MANEKVWNKLYSETEFNDVLKRLDYGLKAPEKLFAYYPWLELLRKNKLKFGRSLEIGAGTGSYSLVLKKLGMVKEVYLLDYSEEALKIAKKAFKKHNVKGHFILGNALNLPFKDKFFDLTISGGLLEHFNEKEQLKIISEEKRVSKYVLNQVPISTLGYWALRLAITLIKGKWPFGYEKPMSKKILKRLYENEGIEIIGEGYHDVLTAVKFSMASKKNADFNFKKKFINKILMNEIAILGKVT